MSDTPRTDAEEFWVPGRAAKYGGVVSASFARHLEREIKGLLTQIQIDGERYRWLRAKHNAGDEHAFVYGAKDDLDEYIDAEMKRGR